MKCICSFSSPLCGDKSGGESFARYMYKQVLTAALTVNQQDLCTNKFLTNVLMSSLLWLVKFTSMQHSTPLVMTFPIGHL